MSLDVGLGRRRGWDGSQSWVLGPFTEGTEGTGGEEVVMVGSMHWLLSMVEHHFCP